MDNTTFLFYKTYLVTGHKQLINTPNQTKRPDYSILYTELHLLEALQSARYLLNILAPKIYIHVETYIHIKGMQI